MNQFLLEDQTKKTTTTSVIINWVSLVILLFCNCCFCNIGFREYSILQQFNYELNCTYFNRMFGQAFQIARRCCIPVSSDYFILQLFYSYHCNHYIGISCQVFHIVSENKCMYGTVDISVFDNCNLLEKAKRLTVKFRKRFNGTRDIRSRYSKHVYHSSIGDVRVLTQRCVSKRDREPSRIPVRTLKCLAKKSRKLREFVYDCIRSNTPKSSKMYDYVKVRKLQKCDTMKAKKIRVLKQRKKHILLECPRSFHPGMMKLKYRARKYLSLFSCNRPMCLYKNQTHLANYYKFKLSSDIEKNPVLWYWI